MLGGFENIIYLCSIHLVEANSFCLIAISHSLNSTQYIYAIDFHHCMLKQWLIVKREASESVIQKEKLTPVIPNWEVISEGMKKKIWLL